MTTEGALPPANTAFHVARLTKRGDFMRASRAPRVAKPGFILQMRKRGPSDMGPARVGFTCSKKVGNAVMRNRAKRRLRELAHLHLSPISKQGYDYVLIGRATTTAALGFARLGADLEKALAELHAKHR